MFPTLLVSSATPGRAGPGGVAPDLRLCSHPRSLFLRLNALAPENLLDFVQVVPDETPAGLDVRESLPMTAVISQRLDGAFQHFRELLVSYQFHGFLPQMNS
jgi:hypothetical protein